MPRKLSCFLLAGAAALSLAACGPAGEAPSPTPSPSQDTPSVSASPAPSAELPTAPDQEPAPSPKPDVYGLPDRDYRPWQEAYMDFLTNLVTKEWADILTYEALSDVEKETAEALIAYRSGDYSLYDVDEDGMPELFVSYNMGTLKRCYTFRDGEVALAGEFPCTRSQLYTCPGESAFLVYCASNSYTALWKYPMEEGTLGPEQTLFSEVFTEEKLPEYIEPDEAVPGAEYIGYFPTHRSPPVSGPDGRPYPSAGKALLLPVCDWYGGPAPTGHSSETARAAILAALDGETELYGAPAVSYFGDTGWTTWEEYIQPGAANPYGDTPLQIAQHVWLDLNGDGQEECVLQLETARHGVEHEYGGTVVLSEQDGAVYAYCLGFFDHLSLYSDGVYRGFLLNQALSFWRGRCYIYFTSFRDGGCYHTALPDAAIQPVEWAEGAPGA